MSQNPPEGYTRVTPYLYYKDAEAALDFITRAFGFTEKVKMTGEDGKIAHCEVELDGGVVMFGTPGADYKNPKDSASIRRARMSTWTTSTRITSTPRRPERRSPARPRTSSTATGATPARIRRDTSGGSPRTSETSPRRR